jgi:hypothetical protein
MLHQAQLADGSGVPIGIAASPNAGVVAGPVGVELPTSACSPWAAVQDRTAPTSVECGSRLPDSPGMPRIAFLVPLMLCAGAAASARSADELSAALAAAAPAADPVAIERAVQAMHCVQPGDAAPATRLALIDYSLPSTAPRLWVFDLATLRLSREERVAHGQGSGDNHATRFSNDPGSHQTSLGLFRTADTYVGRNGYSLRLQGLEPGVNDRAMERAIVMHGAPYVSEGAVRLLGRLGRSWGCPAVRPEIARTLIDEIKGGQYLDAYHPASSPVAVAPASGCAMGNASVAREPAVAPARTRARAAS